MNGVYPNGMTEEQMRRLLERLRNLPRRDPEFFRIWEEGVAEYRHKIQEELERDLAERESK